MAFLTIPKILEQEGSDFYRINQRWQPKTLLADPFRRDLVKEAQRRLVQLDAAEDELQRLDRAPLFIGALKRMRISLRQALFAWRTDDLKFLQNIADFYSDFGTILRHLKMDEGRGKFAEPSV